MNGLFQHVNKLMPFSLPDMFVLGLIPLHTMTATTYKVKRLCHTSFLFFGLSLHSSQGKAEGFSLVSVVQNTNCH